MPCWNIIERDYFVLNILANKITVNLNMLGPIMITEFLAVALADWLSHFMSVGTPNSILSSCNNLFNQIP